MSPTTPSESRLSLDPGRSRPRHAPSFCRLCLGLTVAIIGISICWFIFQVFSGVKKSFADPHRDIFYNGTIDEANSDAFIKPLIDREQRFDIAATVWLRATDEQERIHREEIDGEGVKAANEDDLLETPLYSDIIFRGVRMADKNLRTTISFNLPTARFKEENLTTNDLRGSFVLIPASPSPFDNLSSFVNYLDPPKNTGLAKINYWPSRAWPFPLGSTLREKQLDDRAIDTMSTTVGLVSLHKIDSVCAGDSVVDTSEQEEPQDVALDMLNEYIQNSIAGKNKNPKVPMHPYITTRTQLRLYDEVRPMQLKEFSSRTAKLMSTACGRSFNITSGERQTPKRINCRRTYAENGHWETHFQLDVSNPQFPDVKKYEYRYSPYLDTLNGGHGLTDLVRVPVNRENCTGQSLPMNDTIITADHMTINWTVSFTGRAAYKANLANILVENAASVKPHASNATDFQIARDSFQVELINGLVGHRWREDYHPRFHLLISVILVILSWCTFFGNYHYWYTRQTTAGITVSPFVLYVLVHATTSLVNHGRHLFSKTKSSFGLANAIQISLEILLTLIQLRALLHLDVSMPNKIFGLPGIRRHSPTHRERASQRADAAAATNRLKFVIFGVTLATCLLLKPDEIFIRARTEPTFSTEQDNPLGSLVEFFSRCTVACMIFQTICQILLNYRLRTFGGYHRTVAVLTFLELLFTELGGSPAIVGKFEPQFGTSLSNAFILVLGGIEGMQAIVLPSVGQVDETEHEE